MNFDDTPQEAEFRTTARKWVEANAPKDLEAELAGKFQAMLLRAPGTRVEGGTDEIMRNIIAERVLGLPGDIRVDKDVPFNKIPTKGRN